MATPSSLYSSFVEESPLGPMFQQLFGLMTGNEQAPAPAPAPVQAPIQAPQAPVQAPQSPDLFSQYQSRLDPITQRSESLLKDYYAMSAQLPTFQQRLLDEIKQAGQYPSQAAMREEYMQNPDLTPIAIESLVSRRGQSTRGTIQDIINRAYGGFQSDVESRRSAADLSQMQRSNLLEEYGLEYQAQQNRLTAGGGGTATERYRSSAKQQAERDASKGATSEQLARAYGSVLEPWEILQIYNEAGYYGAPIEDPTGQFYKFLPGYEAEEAEEAEGGLDQEAVSAYVSMIQAGEINLTNVPAEYRTEVSIKLNQVGTEEETPGFFDRIRNVIGL